MSLAEQLQTLYQRFGDLPGITIELHKDLVAIAIRNQQASATVFLQGAQLAEYQPRGQKPVIWCSPDCDYQAGKSLRGGIPVCWPWFGALDKNPAAVQQHYKAPIDAPAHGLVRDTDWQLDNIACNDPDLTELSFSIDFEKDSHPLWPFACRLELQLSIGSELQCVFTVSNRDQHSFSFSSALHSYLAIGDCDDTEIEGLDGYSYTDALLDWSQHPQSGPLRICREIDRIYHPSPVTIVAKDQANDRQISLSSQGSNSTVVWNPWKDKAKRLSCFDDRAYREMLCIETANALGDYVTLEPGTSHQLGVTIVCATL